MGEIDLHRLFLRVTKERQPCQAFLILRTANSQTRFIPRKNEIRCAVIAGGSIAGLVTGTSICRDSRKPQAIRRDHQR